MKYTFECSEKEYVSAIGLMKHLIDAVVGVQELKIKTSRSGVVEESLSCGPDCDHGEEAEPPNATVHPSRVVKPTEEEVEAEIVNEPEPLPAELVKKMKRLKKGEKAFCEFIHEWLKGVDLKTMELIPESEQPDRDLLLRSTANGPSSYAILTFVSECGGLQQAVAKVTNDEDLAVRLCRFIVPPASLAFPDLANQYEYTNPFQKDDEE